jgi:small-conductance mechanosensitive channel
METAKKLLPYGFTSLSLFALSQKVFAADVDKIELKSAQNVGISANESVNNLIKNGFTIAVVVAVILVLGFVIYGAFLWITSGGEKEKTGKSRKMITDALIGLAILALAFFIVRFFGAIVGVNVLENFNIPTLGEKANP